MSYTMTETGLVLTETQECVTMPADYSFATVNDYVHSMGRQYEELECLCLGMACHIDKMTKQRDDLLAALEKANGKLRAATMCHQNAVVTLVEEAYQVTDAAIASVKDHIPEAGKMVKGGDV